MQIVAVDDNAIIQQLLSITFRLDDTLDGHVFGSGDAVMAYASSHAVDVFVIDWVMSPYHGEDLLRDLRALPAFANTPIIVLSADDEDHIKASAKALGATGWMVKPFQPHQLIRVIKKLANPSL
jgi:two-component system chemotaxis response regulator CheY